MSSLANRIIVFWIVFLSAMQMGWSQNETVAPPVDRQTAVTEPQPKPDLSFMFDGSNPTSIEQLRMLESRAREVTEQVKRATVNIRMGQAQGSGIIVSPDGIVLTAAHVIGEPDLTATVILADNRSLKAKTLGINRRFDSGMLKIEGADDLAYIEIGQSTELNPGQWVVAIGHPGGLDRDRGMVLRLGRVLSKGRGVLRTDCVLVGGDSGGPLVDMHGMLIGIHSRIGQSLSENLHVPVDVYSDEWDQLAAGEVVNETPRPYLGFSVVRETTEVSEVSDGKPADVGGLKKGDVIRKIGDKAVSNKQELQKAIDELKIGEEITIFVDREGQKDVPLKIVVGRSWR